MEYLKKAPQTAQTAAANVGDIVQEILTNIENGGEKIAREYAQKFDKYEGDIQLSNDDIEAHKALIPQRLKDDIRFASDNIRRFAQAQKDSIKDFHTEIHPNFIAGQKSIPCEAVGCYVPGGRYAHIASAMMTVATAKIAGCHSISVCSPPAPGKGIHPAITYAAHECGADRIFALGGVQGVAAMAFGLFGMPKADILVGPGNQFVAEAKRILFGRVGIDMFAGPTDSLILADKTADPHIVAWDLVGQAEHGYNSPVWLVTNDRDLARKVLERVPNIIETLPKLNRDNAFAAWRDLGEVVLCANREEMCQHSDRIAPEHLTVIAQDLDYWLTRLTAYGSLFLGEETTVAFGDKASGTNHVLPTSGAARYTGGLSVHKFMKTVTWQRATKEAAAPIAEATARISRLEGMEGHAMTAEVRLKKWSKKPYDLSVAPIDF